MTRKKSNVKALALAVTCAILAGGYSGLNPVYAADKLYKDGGNVTTTTSSSATEITEVTVGGVTIGGSESDDGKIIAKNIVGSTNASAGTLSDININGATFASGGAITANGGLTTNSVNIGGLTISSVDSGSTTSATNYIAGIKDSTGTVTAIGISGTKFESNGAITATSLKLGSDYDVKEKIDKNIENITTNQNNLTALTKDGGRISLLEGRVGVNETDIGVLKTKTAKLSDDGTTLTDMTKVSATTLEVNGKEITGEKVDKYDAAVEKTANITQNTDGSTTVNDVTFKAGAVSGVKSINDKINFSNDGTVTFNDKIKISADGKTVTFNEGEQNGQVQISATGIKVGTGSTYISGDAVYTGGADYDAAKAGMKKEGSLKAADGKFTVDGTNGNTAVGGTLGVTGAATVGGTLGVTGAATVGGTLGVTGNISTDGSVTAKGGLSAANGNFTVEGTTGNTAVGGTLGVTGNATVGGTLDVTGNISTDGSVTAKGGLSAANNAFKVDGTNGNISTDGTLKSKGDFSVGDSNQFTVDAANGNVVSKGKITSQNATIGAVEIANDGTITGVKAITTESLTVSHGFITNGNIESKGLKVNGDAKITGTLGVDGAVTGASFNGAAITATTFNGATIDATHFNNVTLSGGNVEANSIKGTTVTGTTVNDGAGASMNAGTVTGTKITDGVATMTGGNLTGVNSITAYGNITSTSGTIQGVTLTDGVATMIGGQVTAQNGLVVNANNQLTSTGLKTVEISATKGQIGNINIDGATITSNTGTGLTIEGVNINNTALGNVTSIDGVSVGAVTGGNGLEFGGNAVIGATGKPFSSTGFEVDGAGNVTGKSFKVNGSNYLDSNGLTAKAATIGGVNKLDNTGIDTSGTLHVGKEATFGVSTGIHTTINGGTITSTDGTDSTTIGPNKIKTKTLEADTIILNDHMQDGAGNKIEIGADGHLNVAGNNFTIDTIGQMTNEYTGTDAAGRATKTTLKTSVDGINANYNNSVNHNNNLLNINKDGVALGVTNSSSNNLGMLSADANAATMGYGTANSIVVSADTIKSALGTDVTRVMTNSTTEQSIVDKVGAASRSLTAGEIVDAAGGMTITTNNTGTTFSNGTNTTLINGSAITSTNGAATGVLDGSNLTLTNGANSTALTAGGATFTGAAGDSSLHGTETKINGGIITTDTLNVERINLGENILDTNGTPHGSNLSMDKQGNFSAAGGNFKVTGGTGADKGAFTNTVGNTTLQTDTTGASMKYNNGTVESNVSVGDNSAMVSAGASSIEVKNEGITNNGKTTFKGAVDATVSTTETTINGNTITTGHLITDRLTITGSGAAAGAGTGTIALGGDGSITSNIKDAATGKEATFQTNADGTFTEAKDGANVTTNTVNAQGNTNKVTDGTNTSTATQTATSIGGVITHGTVELAKAELNKDGFTVKQDGKTDVKIADGDVTVTNNKNTATPNQEVHLSDLGSLNNLDGELAARDEYKNNQTAVGAINAEAGIRREEVARLDNRIDDVNNRVDKVGAMAAAIASLKSIGYDPQAPSEFSIGLGQYKGETGVAMGFFHYPNKNFMINVSLSTAGGETMGGIGATWRFGHKSPQKLLDEQREAQARKELAAAEKYQAAAKLAKEAQERAEYAAKLARQAQVSADNAKAAADATQAKHFQ